MDAACVFVGDLEMPAVLAVEFVEKDAALLQENVTVAVVEVVVDAAEPGPFSATDAVLFLPFQVLFQVVFLQPASAIQPLRFAAIERLIRPTRCNAPCS